MALRLERHHRLALKRQLTLKLHTFGFQEVRLDLRAEHELLQLGLLFFAVHLVVDACQETVGVFTREDHIRIGQSLLRHGHEVDASSLRVCGEHETEVVPVFVVNGARLIELLKLAVDHSVLLEVLVDQHELGRIVLAFFFFIEFQVSR